MNERILELARQVWPDPNTSHVNHEKFAELLISAVMAEVKDEVQFQCGWANAEIVENRVKKEFGV
jgi:hypothetical protein